jgi:hypothetical protein
MVLDLAPSSTPRSLLRSTGEIKRIISRYLFLTMLLSRERYRLERDKDDRVIRPGESYDTRFPAEENSISFANRRSRVSSRFASMTHHVAAF